MNMLTFATGSVTMVWTMSDMTVLKQIGSNLPDVTARALEVLGGWCRSSVVGCCNEHVAKALLLEDFLRLGWTMEEGTSSANGRKRISFTGRSVNAIGTNRTLMKGKSLDLMVAKPLECRIELQARTAISSQDVSNTTPIREDIGRVQALFADCFILICDQPQYEKLSGIRDARGRPVAADVQAYYRQQLSPGEREYSAAGMRVRQLIVQSPVGHMRVITGITR